MRASVAFAGRTVIDGPPRRSTTRDLPRPLTTRIESMDSLGTTWSLAHHDQCHEWILRPLTLVRYVEESKRPRQTSPATGRCRDSIGPLLHRRTLTRRDAGDSGLWVRWVSPWCRRVAPNPGSVVLGHLVAGIKPGLRLMSPLAKIGGMPRNQ